MRTRAVLRIAAVVVLLALPAGVSGRAPASDPAPDPVRSPASARAPVSVTASVSPDSATVGDRLILTVTLDRADDVRVDYPDMARALSPFELLDESLTRSETVGDRTVERRDYAIAAFRTGELTVPGLDFEYVTAEGDTGFAATDSLAVTIGSVLPEVKEGDEVGPLDIKPPIELPRRVWPWIVAALSAAALAAAIYYVRRWLRRRPFEEEEKPAGPPKVPRRSAHIVALERLDALENADLIGRGEIPAFYVRVTEIIRLYIRDRFAVDAIDMTTAELVPAMRDARIGEDEIGWTTGYLGHADLAKFAKHVPSPERARRDLTAAREFVERTRLRGEEAGPDGEASGETAGAAGEEPHRENGGGDTT